MHKGINVSTFVDDMPAPLQLLQSAIPSFVIVHSSSLLFLNPHNSLGGSGGGRGNVHCISASFQTETGALRSAHMYVGQSLKWGSIKEPLQDGYGDNSIAHP